MCWSSVTFIYVKKEARPPYFFPTLLMPSRYGQVGSGYSQEELEELNGRLEGSWKTFDM